MLRMFPATSLCLLAATAFVGSAQAEWPNDRPIELIVAYAAGGGTDVMHRTMEPYLEKVLGAEIVVLNRPGATGEIAYTALTQAEPDGYTLSSINTPSFLTMQISRKLGYDPQEICPVARIVEDPSALIVRADSEFQTLEDLVNYAKSNPGAVSIGTTGVGSDEHIALIQLEQAAGIDLTPIPFGGSSETRTALLGGHVTAIGLNIGELIQADRSKLRAIAQLSEERSSLTPDVPTATEQGFDVFISSERGLGTRCDVPQEIRNRLADAVEQVLANPDFQAQAKNLTLPLAYVPGDKWLEQMPQRLERFRTILKQVGTEQ